MASKRKRLTLKEKIDILEFRTSNTMGVRALADKFSVSKTQIADIIANKDALYKIWAENGEEKRKWTKLQKTETSIIDNEVLNWFSKLREKNLPVSGPMLQEKSKQIAEMHGFDFKGSNAVVFKLFLYTAHRTLQKIFTAH
ncbi:jerky protein homolog-like [Melanaphis sacchari]|uniref:jerky protein homolog-like n=1 Tax=Melanaphis sacchari TaxID=742174 RepID=UPI000DC14F46|nr:jerky protein homolog-like [Melanaphis sacchari]